jgi:cytochrome c biogenesis protein CcdA
VTQTLPLIFAFTAGMVATVNPCGFAMVPVYLSLLLTDTTPTTSATAWRRGLRVGGWVTVGFLVTFGAIGLLVAVASTRLLSVVPWVALVLGVGLVGYGVVVLRSGGITIPTFEARFDKTGSRRGLAVFGVAYGIASLSCTLPVFLAVSGAALAATNLASGAAVFAAYGLGMGLVLTAVAVAVATSRQALVGLLRSLGRHLSRIGGWMLIASGVFIVYYWATALAITPTADPNPWLAPSRVVETVSSRLQTSIGANPWLWAASAIAVIIVGAATTAYSRRRRSPEGEGVDGTTEEMARRGER